MQATEVNPPATAARAGPDGFLVFETGFAQVNVNVDETGCEVQPPAVVTRQRHLPGTAALDRVDLAVDHRDVSLE
jgi:hypothetical protein